METILFFFFALNHYLLYYAFYKIHWIRFSCRQFSNHHSICNTLWIEYVCPWSFSNIISGFLNQAYFLNSGYNYCLKFLEYLYCCTSTSTRKLNLTASLILLHCGHFLPFTLSGTGNWIPESHIP
jgi:hypothetical protein